jgi:hypothetical protein
MARRGAQAPRSGPGGRGRGGPPRSPCPDRPLVPPDRLMPGRRAGWGAAGMEACRMVQGEDWGGGAGCPLWDRGVGYGESRG